MIVNPGNVILGLSFTQLHSSANTGVVREVTFSIG